jgi:hypothetical protein
MNADTASTSRTLPSSDGWKRKNGSSIQRFEPRVALASAKTSRMVLTISPYVTYLSSRNRE